MATPKDLLDYAGERLYRNSLDDVLDQIQQDIDNERAIQQARQNAIVNSQDPVKKLKEVQSIEKSVVNELPEVQKTVLNQTYQTPVGPPVQPQQNQFMLPPDGTQPTIGQPRGVQQQLSDDELEYYSELERIQEPFDRIFQEKLKTAKEIPGRYVSSMTGMVPVPGKTKEEVAKQQTIKELEDQGIIKGQGIRNFLTTAIPLGGLTPKEQAQQTYFPVRTALAQLGGAFAGLGVTSQVIKAPKIAKASYDAVRRGTKIGNFLTQKGINTVKAGKFTASATTGAGTFGAYRTIDQIDEDASIQDKAKTIVEDAIFGAGFGLTGSLNNPATRSLAEGTFGFVTSKLMEGATTQEALLNGLLFAGFGVLNKRNMSDVEKGIAINEFKKVGDDSFRIIQDLRKQSGQKQFTKLQEKQWKKARDEFAERFRYEKYSPEQVKADTEEFITRFLQTNDPKGSIARIRQLGNQAKTQSLQAKAKAKRETVDVPTTGKADKVSQDNVVKMAVGQQVKELKGLGYTDDQLVRLSGKERADIIANAIKPVNYYKEEQPTRPSMPVPGPAPDVTPSTKKSDKLVPEKLEPKPEEVKPEVKPEVEKEPVKVEPTPEKPTPKTQIAQTQQQAEYNIVDQSKRRNQKKKTNVSLDAKGLSTIRTHPKFVKIDESKFQPREKYNQAIIDDIAENFDPAKWEEPILWEDPKTGEYTVVSGHHRHLGVKKGGFTGATYKVLPKGTSIDDAINMSEEGNLARTEQSSFENSKIVRRRFEKGDSLVSIANALPGLTRANSSAGKSNAVRKLLNLSYLDNKGSLKSNYDSVNEFPKIQSTSSYVGGLRKQYDWMTDKYEDDIFTYLYTENNIRQNDVDWKLNVESTLEKIANMKERPGSIIKQLRKDPLQPKEGTSNEVLEEINKQKNYIETLNRQLNDPKEIQTRIKKKQEIAYKQKYQNPDVVGRKYDDKWKAKSTWDRNLWRLTIDERNRTEFGEDVMVGKYPSGALNDLDKKHIDAIVKANERGELIRPEVVNDFRNYEEIKNTGIVADDKAIYQDETSFYNQIVDEIKKERKDAKRLLKQMIEEANIDDPNQSSMFEPTEQYNIFGGTNILPDISKKDKQILDDLHKELANINREQFFLLKQISDNRVNKLQARKLQKELDKKFKDTIKKMQKIDKPVNGATAKPGIAIDMNEQIQLDLGGKKQTELFRETATKEDKENTKVLQRGLSRLRSRLGITERASSIIAPLEKVGASHFIGQKVSGPEELALISQIARDKRYETFRIFFTKSQGVKDKIVNYTAYTNRMPGWVNVFPGPFARSDYDRESSVAGLQALTQWMYKAMKDAGADGYYLMHNHPSGNVNASKADINITKKIAKEIPGFRGHVILNHNKYGLIDSNQNEKKLWFDEKYHSMSDPLINEKYYETMPIHFDVKNIPVLKRFQEQENVVTIFATDYNHRIHSITDIPLQKFIDVGKKHKYGLGLARIKTQLRKIASTYGGQRLYLTSKSTDMTGKEVENVHRVWKRLFKDNFITDGYFFQSYEDPTNYYGLATGMGRKTRKGTLDFNPGAKVPKALKEPSIADRNTHLEGFEARAEADGIELDLSINERLKAVKLHLIKIPKDKRNQGIGTKTMRQVLDYVDDQGLLMTLTPSSEFGSSKRRLVEFYKSFGFRLNSGPHRDLRFKDTMIRKPFKSLKIREQVQSLDEIKIQSNFANWFGKSKAVDIDGNPEVFYHGTQRPDRIGSVFYKSRAHSGPMSYFTNDPEIASGYARGKSDDSLIIDDWTQLYSIGKQKGLRSAWWQLTDQQKNNFNEKAYKVGLNLNNEVVLDEDYRYINKSTYDYFLKEANGNGLIAVFQAWIGGGYFIGEEKRLLEVFKVAGVSNIKFDDPRAVMPGVFPVYLSMQNPLNTDNIPSKIVEGLRKRSKRQPSPKYMQGTTHWDKEARKPEDWIWALNEDVKNNTSLAWTSIPDWVTRYLKQQGYDGIMDVGGKYNPENPHSVAIPFEPNQVKSKFNRGTFSKKSKNIMKEQEKMFKNPASTLTSIKQLETKAEVPKKVYDDAKARSVMDLAKERKKELKGPGLISRALTPLSTRLRVLAPELKRSIRKFQFNVDINTAKDLKVAENFMKQTDKLRRKNKQDYAVLDLAMKNSDLKKAQEILDKHNMGNEFVKVRNMLDNIYVRAEMVGYEPNYLSDYFPRRIKDSDGLMGYLEASDSWGIIQSNIKSKEKELGRRLEKDERLKLINNLIRGFGGRLGIQRPANLKEREIEYLDSELNEFYYDSNTSLHKYIVQMNEAIETKRFFGKSMGPEDPNIQVDNNVVGEYVDTLLEQGVIKSTQQDELINLLRLRFAQGPMDPRMAKMRNTAYLFTMGQLSSAVTQIGDMAWSIYNAGLPQTTKALGKSIIGKSSLTRKDIGIEKIAQEFTETDKAHKVLDKVFTLTGLKYIDSLGKESLINSTLAQYQKQARKGKFSSKLQERLNEAFDKKELPKVIADLKSGEVTDDIKYLAHYTLSDFQPVSLTEMPEFYLKAPNGRVMYMLKTYTIKQFDVVRNEAFKKMNEGKTVKEKAEGVRRLIYLASVLMLTGMSADKIKNYMYGREQEFDEMVGDNLLRLVGFQKYLLWHFRRYKNVAWTTVKAIIPPIGVFNPVVEGFVRDLDKYQRTKKKGEEFKIPGDTESVKNIPIVGRLYYNYFGNGEKFHAKRKEKEQKKSKKKKGRPQI